LEVNPQVPIFRFKPSLFSIARICFVSSPRISVTHQSKQNATGARALCAAEFPYSVELYLLLIKYVSNEVIGY
jgi:hypothetical protein